SWLEHYTDNVGVSSSNLLGTTRDSKRISSACDCKGELAQLARAPALHAGGQRFESVILHMPLPQGRGQSSLTYWEKKKTEEDRGSPVLASVETGRRQSAAGQKGQRTEESK